MWRAVNSLRQTKKFCVPNIIQATLGPIAAVHEFSASAIKSVGAFASPLESILRHQKHKEESFYVVHLDKLKESARLWRDHMRNIQGFYAVKCNPDPVYIQVLGNMGFHFDCASPSEIDLVIQQGVEPHRILYANPFKRACDIEYAYEKGVRCTTFDTLGELDKIMKTCPEMKVILRIYANDPTARCCLSNKFGAHRHDWELLLKAAHRWNANLCGVSFHVGSGAMSPAAFTHAIRECRDVITMAEQLGFEPSIVDIGGGFSKKTLPMMAEPILSALREHFADPKYQWIAEPGRYFAEDPMTLYTKVMGVRPNPDGTMNYIITDGLYGSFNGILYDHSEIEPKTMKNEYDAEKRAAALFGPTCDGFDCIGKNINLPILSIGDIIYFENMGAYTIGAACDFNGIHFTKVKKYYL